MSIRTRLLRLVAGLVILTLTLAASFSVFIPQTVSWGATNEEVALALPGDSLAPQPVVNWTNALTINAPPEQVWPWIAQLGDTRGGFYSYTFIEDRIASITGASGYIVDYENADRIVPEWQNPAVGDVLIQDSLHIREVQPGKYLLADLINPGDGQWTWLWSIEPVNNGAQTRLIVRCKIQIPPAAQNPIQTGIITVGGFVMQQRMLHGLALRAEGGSEAAYTELLKIVLWLMMLVIGLIAAVLFLFQNAWQNPLALAVISVAGLVALTFIQPAIWLRVLIIVILLVDLWWAYRPAGSANQPFRTQSVAS